jgi:hypothetical protein
MTKKMCDDSLYKGRCHGKETFVPIMALEFVMSFFLQILIFK